MDIQDSLRLDSIELKKVEKVGDYIFRNRGVEITSTYSNQVNLKEKVSILNNEYAGYKYRTVTMSTFIYVTIPSILKMGKINVQLEDYYSLLDIYVEEVDYRLSTEEVAENVHETIENEIFGI